VKLPARLPAIREPRRRLQIFEFSAERDIGKNEAKNSFPEVSAARPARMAFAVDRGWRERAGDSTWRRHPGCCL
jgi:hypothetical protein